MKRILIADDEECLLIAYKKLLAGNGVEIDTAQSASDAQTMLGTYQYSIIIVDLRLTNSNEMDGLDIIKIAHHLHPDCTIIVLTAYGDYQIKQNVINAGAAYFLEKPISVLAIRDLLNNLGVYCSNVSLQK